MASSAALKRWLRPEVYPLFAAVGVAVGICGMQLVRNITTNPEVRVTKENRAAGVLDNFAEGEKYAEHALRKFVRNRAPEIMPSINSFFTDPKKNELMSAIAAQMDLPTNTAQTFVHKMNPEDSKSVKPNPKLHSSWKY